MFHFFFHPKSNPTDPTPPPPTYIINSAPLPAPTPTTGSPPKPSTPLIPWLKQSWWRRSRPTQPSPALSPSSPLPSSASPNATTAPPSTATPRTPTSPAPAHDVASAFQGLTKPAISVRSYLERIFRYANCSPTCFVVAYIYLDRFLQRHRPAIALDSFNVHRLLITSVLTAVKFMEDRYYNNAYFAKVGGISLVEMNYLEVDFLFGIGFKLNVTPVTFSSYCSILQREMYTDQFTPSPSRLHCCLTEEESNGSCQQKQQLAM